MLRVHLFAHKINTNCLPLCQVLKETFPEHTFLMNGLIQGVKVKNEEFSKVTFMLFVLKIIYQL